MSVISHTQKETPLSRCLIGASDSLNKMHPMAVKGRAGRLRICKSLTRL